MMPRGSVRGGRRRQGGFGVEDVMAELFPTVIAGALVTGFAWARFPAPGIAQIATTQIQFYWSRAAYVLAALAFYAALAKAIGAADGLACGPAPSPYVWALLMYLLQP